MNSLYQNNSAIETKSYSVDDLRLTDYGRDTQDSSGKLLDISLLEKAGMHTIVITPTIAQQLLNRNTKNRPWKLIVRNRYMRAMVKGRWKFNAETIKVATTGRLLDGQHRLMACVECGVPFKTYLAVLEDESVFDTIDIGSKRTSADALSVTGEKNSKILASTLALLIEYDNYGDLANRRGTITPQDTLDALEKHPSIRDSVSVASSQGKKGELLTRTAVAFCHSLFTKKDSTDADRFLRAVLYGENLKRGDGAYVLREHLQQIRLRKNSQMPRNDYLIAVTIKAWNSYRTGKPCYALKYLETEQFPSPK